MNFFQMHHIKCGDHVHKFKHILSEDFKVAGSAILYYAGLMAYFILLH